VLVTSNVTIMWMTEILLYRGLVLNFLSDSLSTDYLEDDILLNDSYKTDYSGEQYYDQFLNTLED